MVNTTYEQWFGLSRELLFGRTIREILGEELYESRKSKIEAALRGEHVAFEALTPKPDGRPRMVEMQYIPRLGAAGQPNGFYIYGRDITERKKREEKLRGSEVRLRVALDAGRMAAWELDLLSGKLVGSGELCLLLGIPENEAREPHAVPSNRLSNESARLRSMAGEALQRGDRQLEAEIRSAQVDGSDLWLIVRAELYFDPTGAAARWVGVLLDITNQKLVEQARLASEERYRLAVRAFHGAPYESHLNSGYGFRDPRAYEMLGLQPEECEPTREWWFDRVHPEDLQPLQDAIDNLVQGRASELDVEYRIRHQTGRWVWIWQRGLLLMDAANRPDRLFGALLAITERKETEAALRESELLKSAILTSALDCIVTIDQDSRVVEWNAACEQTFGYPREDALGQDLAELIIPPELRDRHRRGMAHYLATGEGPVLGKRIEVAGLRSDGSRIPVDLAISPIKVPGRLYFTAYLRDLTERNRAAAALRANEQRLRATHEHAFAGIAEVDRDGRFIRVNEHFCKITGYSREELLRRTFMDITHPEDRHQEEEQFGRQMTGELERYSLEKRFLHKDGYDVWIELLASRVDDDAGHPLYGIRVTRDITDRKRAERHQELLIDELNHRVKNTLATVQSIVWQSLKNASSPQEARASVEARLSSLSRAHDVLTSEGWENAELRDIIAQAIEPYHRGHSSDRFIINAPEIKLPPRLALAFAMVLHELSTNAVKYGSLTSPTGVVRIDCRVENSAGATRVLLEWREAGGPLVAPPKRRGFGSLLIERSFDRSSGCSARVSFVPSGLVCSIEVQLPPPGPNLSRVSV